MATNALNWCLVQPFKAINCYNLCDEICIAVIFLQRKLGSRSSYLDVFSCKWILESFFKMTTSFAKRATYLAFFFYRWNTKFRLMKHFFYINYIFLSEKSLYSRFLSVLIFPAVILPSAFVIASFHLVACIVAVIRSLRN